MAGAVGWERWRRALLVLGIGVTVFGVLHHIDHVVRGNHSGWPFREEVTPFTFSLLVYALLLPGIYMNLRDRVAAGWWRDPDFVTATQKQTVPVWENLRERGIDAAWWFGRMEDIATRGRAALTKGATPQSVEVQEIVDDWVALFARAAGESPTPDFVRRFAQTAPGWVENADDKTRRLRELLAILDAGDLISSQERVNELLIAGLGWRAAREAPEGS
jgi:hypothetical protein